jgi:hypothetical protein
MTADCNFIHSNIYIIFICTWYLHRKLELVCPWYLYLLLASAEVD